MQSERKCQLVQKMVELYVNNLLHDVGMGNIGKLKLCMVDMVSTLVVH